MSKNFRTSNLDTHDLFADDLTSGESIDMDAASEESTLSPRPAKGKEEIISELDSLRLALNEGPEFQQDIPLLEDIEDVPEGSAIPVDLDVPILTDTCDDKATPAVNPTPVVNPQESLTDIADASIDQLLDEIMEEYLPKLEARLRAELNKKIRATINANRNNSE